MRPASHYVYEGSFLGRGALPPGAGTACHRGALFLDKCFYFFFFTFMRAFGSPTRSADSRGGHCQIDTACLSFTSPLPSQDPTPHSP